MSIYKKLSDFQNEVEAVKKKSTNPHFKSKYASLDEVLDVIKEPLKKVKLAFTQTPQLDGLKTMIVDTENETEYITSVIPYLLTKNDMQGLGSAITYARRYALVSMLGLEQEDDDGNKACEPKQQQKTFEKPQPLPPLKQYLSDNSFTADEIAAFYTLNKITTAAIATATLEDKAALTELIQQFKNPVKV